MVFVALLVAQVAITWSVVTLFVVMLQIDHTLNGSTSLLCSLDGAIICAVASTSCDGGGVADCILFSFSEASAHGLYLREDQ